MIMCEGNMSEFHVNISVPNLDTSHSPQSIGYLTQALLYIEKDHLMARKALPQHIACLRISNRPYFETYSKIFVVQQTYKKRFRFKQVWQLLLEIH